MQETPKPPPLTKTQEKFVQQIASVMLREPEDFQQRLDQLRNLYQPTNIQEEFWLTQIAQCQLRMGRLGWIESGLFSLFIEKAKDEGFTDVRAFPEPMQEDSELAFRQRTDFVLAFGFRKIVAQVNVLPLFFRYQLQAERHLRRAQEQFDRIRKAHLTPPASPSPPPPEEAAPDAGTAAKQRTHSLPPRRARRIQSRLETGLPGRARRQAVSGLLSGGPRAAQSTGHGIRESG